MSLTSYRTAPPRARNENAAARDYRRLAHAITEWPAPQQPAGRRFFMNRRSRNLGAASGHAGRPQG